ncbi:hypothetical protein CgunFtcFv8_019027 [Champsocephalus gunnari]|uniref:Uncharacterized protein n=1 Tax=Champsocephalus gunnari TaxID=52237 RepID=A0AAN8HNC3_CHAGU|nr:hypothetical protein CgunFtcFv8_019027 [Champsocephalus gunnari]
MRLTPNNRQLHHPKPLLSQLSVDFVLSSIPVTEEEDAQIPRWSSSTWLEVGREMTPPAGHCGQVTDL